MQQSILRTLSPAPTPPFWSVLKQGRKRIYGIDGTNHIFNRRDAIRNMKLLIGVLLLALAPWEALGGRGSVTISKLMLANSTGTLFLVNEGTLTNLRSGLHVWYYEDATDGSDVSPKPARPAACAYRALHHSPTGLAPFNRFNIWVHSLASGAARLVC